MTTLTIAFAPNNEERKRPNSYKKALADVERVHKLNQNLSEEFPDDPFLADTVKHLATRKKQLQKHILSGTK